MKVPTNTLTPGVFPQILRHSTNLQGSVKWTAPVIYECLVPTYHNLLWHWCRHHISLTLLDIEESQHLKPRSTSRSWWCRFHAVQPCCEDTVASIASYRNTCCCPTTNTEDRDQTVQCNLRWYEAAYKRDLLYRLLGLLVLTIFGGKGADAIFKPVCAAS